MDGLFKLIFYILIGIVWALSTTKKKVLWDDAPDNLPKALLRPNPLPNLMLDEPPSEEGDFSEPVQTVSLQNLGKELSIKQKKVTIPPPVLDPDMEIAPDEPENFKSSSPAIVANRRQKQSYYLKSSLKEGIIWSIVLGAPRSKQAFNRLKSPLNR